MSKSNGYRAPEVASESRKEGRRPEE